MGMINCNYSKIVECFVFCHVRDESDHPTLLGFFALSLKPVAKFLPFVAGDQSDWPVTDSPVLPLVSLRLPVTCWSWTLLNKPWLRYFYKQPIHITTARLWVKLTSHFLHIDIRPSELCYGQYTLFILQYHLYVLLWHTKIRKLYYKGN